MTPPLAELLIAHRAELERLVEREGGALRKLESRDDLVQGVHLRALAMEPHFEFRGEPAFRAWLGEVARRHLADRRDYWRALKRRSGRIVRLTWSGTNGESAGGERAPASTATGPSTFAARREELALVARALGLLAERDRELVRWQSEGIAIEEQAQRIGLSVDSARRAAQRALDRFRKTWRLLKQGSPPQP